MFCKEHPSVFSDRLREISIYINVKNINENQAIFFQHLVQYFFLTFLSFKYKGKDFALYPKQVFDFAIETYYSKTLLEKKL